MVGMVGQSHIVVVEDEPTQRHLLMQYLSRRGFRVTGVDGGAALRVLMDCDIPTLVLLDISLPGEDGFSLARYLRQKSPEIAIIMVTASGDTIDRVAGLETGADDYIPKPFDPRELLARVNSVLRRVAAAGPPPQALRRVRMGRRVLDLDRHMLLDDSGADESLAASEFDLLRLFAEHPNRPLARDWLLESTSNRETDVFDRAIDVRINRLRRKIEVDPAHPDSIRTVRGVGYMFVPPKEQKEPP